MSDEDEEYNLWNDGCVVFIMIGVAVVLLPCVGFMGMALLKPLIGEGEVEEESEASPKSKAWYYCEKMTRKRLKSPSSAELPWGPDVLRWEGDNKVKVEFNFSAKNPMNVRLQKRAYCTVTFDDTGEAEDIDLTFQ